MARHTQIAFERMEEWLIKHEEETPENAPKILASAVKKV